MLVRYIDRSCNFFSRPWKIIEGLAWPACALSSSPTRNIYWDMPLFPAWRWSSSAAGGGDGLFFIFWPACARYAREKKRLLRGFIASSLVVGLKIDCVFELPFSSTRLPYLKIYQPISNNIINRCKRRVNKPGRIKMCKMAPRVIGYVDLMNLGKLLTRRY